VSRPCGRDVERLDNSTRSQSIIYEWFEDSEGQGQGQFKDVQSIEVVGARDWTHFTVDSYHFLVVASARSESSPPPSSSSSNVQLQYSVIYLWQSGRFIPFQTIEVCRFITLPATPMQTTAISVSYLRLGCQAQTLFYLKIHNKSNQSNVSI